MSTPSTRRSASTGSSSKQQQPQDGTPQNNLLSMRERLAPFALNIDLPANKPAFQLARARSAMGARSTPSLSGMRQGELLRAPQSTNGTPAALPTAQSHYFTPQVQTTSVSGQHSFGTPGSSGSGACPSKLDNWSLDKLNALLVRHQDEKITLLEQKSDMDGQNDDFDMDNDPEMIDAKLKLLTKRVNELKAAIAARSQLPSSGASTLGTPQVSEVYPSPMPTDQREQPSPTVLLSHAARDQPRPVPVVRTVAPAYEPQPEAGPSRRQTAYVPDEPEFDEEDIAAAEAWDNQQNELVPESSPLQSRRPSKMPNRSMDASTAIAEMDDIPHDLIFSSPIDPPQPLPSTSPSKRTVGTSPMKDIGGPMPSSSCRTAMPIVPRRTIQVEIKHPWSKEVKDKLIHVFKIGAFRQNQKEAIDATMAGKDVFVLMPTGGGKSLTYQLPAICSGGKTKGVTFVVSPLISLINDQTRHLIKRNIPAIAYTGDLTAADKHMAHEELSRPDPYTKVVYVTPEMLTMGGRIKPIMRNLIANKRLARFVIDEAHCVSAWGHDFRADYLRLGELRQQYPGVPIMALTATAPNKVQDDIVRTLGIQGCEFLKMSFNRPNLHYEVRPKKKELLGEIAGFIGTQEPGASGIIYCSSREKCENVAKELRDSHNVKAWHYHAGMSKGDRRKVQEGWQEHKFDVIVATIAFGMGIDKPDVRYVIHHAIPRSLEGYYQETGRAGRDGKNATCILYYHFGDSKSVMNFIERDPNLRPEQKNRQKDSVQEVLRFCQNLTDCRRKQVLRFFNEDFDPAQCNQGCDVCLNRDQNKYKTVDVLEDARNLIKMVQAFGRDDRVTQKNVADCFRGMGGSTDKGLGNNPHFGVGKSWRPDNGARLVQNLLLDKALDEYYTTNGAGWSNGYVKLGKRAPDFLNGKIKLWTMDFRDEPAKVAKTKATKKTSTRKDSGAARKVPNQTTLNESVKRTRDALLDEIQAFDDSPWGDSGDDDYVDTRPGNVPAPVKRPKRASTAAGGAATINNASPAESCLEELRKLRKKGSLPLSDDVLQMIAAIMPANQTAVSKIEGLTAAQASEYHTKILGVTTRFLHLCDDRTVPAQLSTSALSRKKQVTASGSKETSKASTKAPVKAPTKSNGLVHNLSSYMVQTSSSVVPAAPRPSSSVATGRLPLARTGSATTPRF